MRAKKLIIVGLLLALVTPIVQADDLPAEDWPMLNHDPARTCVTINQAAPPFIIRDAYRATNAIHSSVAITPRFAIMGSDDTKIYCYDTYSFRIRWTKETKNRVRSSPTIFENLVVCGSDDGVVYCLNLEDGKENWIFETGDMVRSSPLIVNGKVYIASMDNKLYCLNVYTGEKIWAAHTGGIVEASPTYSEKGRLIIIGSYAQKMFAFKADNGQIAWTFDIDTSEVKDNKIIASCSVANERVFFGDNAGNVYCLNSTTGKEVWKKHFENEKGEKSALIAATPAVIEDMVILPTGYDKMVRCFYQDTGEIVWEYRTGSWNYSSPAIGGKYVYFGSDDQNLYCLNWRTGQEIWKGNLGYIIEASPVIYDQAVYVGTWGGTVQVFRPGPILEIEPKELDYGIVELGSTPFIDFTVRNARRDAFPTQLEGKIELVDKHLTLSATEFFGIENSSERKLRITLDPAGLEFGNHQALIKITSNGGETQLIVRWRIVTPAPPCLKVQPTDLDFGFMNRGEEKSKTVVLTFDTDKEVSGMVMGEDRWIDVEPVSFTSVGKKAIIKVIVNASRIPVGNDAVGRIILATKDDVCQQVSVEVKVETEPRIEIAMTIGEKTAFVNNRPVEMDVAPYLTSKGRTMVPIRFISETFGAEVKWIQENKEIRIQRFDRLVVLWVGKPEIQVDAIRKAIPSPPEIKEGRTMVPFRAIAEGFNAVVTWDGETKTVRMEYEP